MAPAYGVIRKVAVQGNVIINTSGVATLGVDSSAGTYGIRNPNVGQSRRVRQLDVSSNWIANLHDIDQIPPDPTSKGVTFIYSGDPADAYGTNGIQLNDNVMTTIYDGTNHRSLDFSRVKEFYGTDNKVFRPDTDTTGNPGGAGNIGFLWDKTFTAVDPVNMQITNTLDNGWMGSRLVCNDNTQTPAWFFCSLTGAVSEPNDQPVRVMIFRNGIPEGLRTIEGTEFISLSSKPSYGDSFYIQAFNENGWSDDYSFTY